MVSNKNVELGKEFEQFGKRIRHIYFIEKAGNSGIIINDLSDKLKKHPTQVGNEVKLLASLGIVNIEKKSIKGKGRNCQFITLTGKGKNLLQIFEQYKLLNPEELKNESIKKINKSIERFYNSRSPVAKETSILTIKDIISQEIKNINYNWKKVPKLTKFINDFLKDFENANKSQKQNLYSILYYIYASGYLDEKNFKYIQEHFKNKKPDECKEDLTTVFSITFFALKNWPDNSTCYKFLFFLIKIAENFDSSHKTVIDSSRDRIKSLPDFLKDRLFEDLDTMVIESNDDVKPLTRHLIEILSYKY